MSMEHAIENGPGEPALTIEKCQCPPSYQGSSCQVQFTICAFFHAGFFSFFLWISCVCGVGGGQCFRYNSPSVPCFMQAG